MAAVARHPLSLMSCVREPPPGSPTSSSPPDPFTDHKKCSTGPGNSFRPLRGLRRIFRRKPRATAPAIAPAPTATHPVEATSPVVVSGAVGTCSTPEYLGRVPGRSVSHDSVFTTEAGGSAEHSASPSASDSAHSLHQVVSPTSAAVAAELVGALRRRGQCRDSSEDNAVKQDQNACVNGSSLSVASSNIEEEWAEGTGVTCLLPVSSLLPSEKSPSPVDIEGAVNVSTAPLSHTAARHKMAVKPRRNHGGPSRARRRPNQVSTPSLPTTPELNEDSPVDSSDSKVFSDADSHGDSGFLSGTRRAGSATPPSPEPVHGPSNAHQLKSASLPPGLALRPVAVTRSRSSATYHQTARENVAKYPRSGSSEQLAERSSNQDPERRDKEKSFFSRLLSRRSGKKKKKDADDSPLGSDAYLSVYASQDAEVPFTPRRMDERGRYAEGTVPATTQYTANKQSKVSSVARTGPAARQRADPQTILARTDVDSGDEDVRPRYDKASPLEGVPVPVKPESAGVTRMQISYSTSPPKPFWTNHFTSDEDLESKSKVRLPALSAFQKRVSAVAMMEYDDAESRSVRSEVDSLDAPAPPKTTSQDSLSRCNDNCSDVMGHFEQEINTIALAPKGDSSCGSTDSLEPVNAEKEYTLTQNLFVASEDARRDSDMPPSLDSIENQERSLSRAEDSLGMYQVTIPFGSDGVSITQRVMDIEEPAVTVACGPPPSVSVPNITLISLTDTQHGTVEDESHVSVHIETKVLEKEAKTESQVKTQHGDTVEVKLDRAEPKVIRQHEKTEREETSREKTDKREKPLIPDKPDFPSDETGPLHRAEEKPVPAPRRVVIQEEAPVVPEFMRVQLNHVDSKPSVNVVLSTSSLEERKRDEEETDKADVKKDQRRESVEGIETTCEKDVESSIVSEAILVDPCKGLASKEAPSLNCEEQRDEVPVPSKSPVKPVKPLPLPTSQKPTLIPPAKKSPVKKVPCKPEVLKSLEPPTEPMKKILVEERDKLVIVEKKKKSPSPPPAQDEPVVLRKPSRDVTRDGAKSWDSAQTAHSEVVLRKKSLPKEVGSKKEDEPELMKVFARRSLKVKDGDEVFVIAQAWNTEASPDSAQEKSEEKNMETLNRSRDSDKENDGAESPKDERKKEPKETKSVINAFKNDIMKTEVKKDALPEKRLRIRNIADVPVEKTNDKPKFGRTALLHSESVEEKAVSGESDVPPKVASRWMPVPAVSSATTLAPPAPAAETASLPRFKRIQQRKEEWEQRAQQAAGKAAP